MENGTPQWMQNPTSEEGAILKREWWKTWDKDWLPDCHYIIMSMDTAFLKKETADYSAITTWGVFYPNEDSKPNLILLDALKERYEFPELRRVALDQYKYWNPDMVIVEQKSIWNTFNTRIKTNGHSSDDIYPKSW